MAKGTWTDPDVLKRTPSTSSGSVAVGSAARTAAENRAALAELPGWKVGPIEADEEGRPSFVVTMPGRAPQRRSFDARGLVVTDLGPPSPAAPKRGKRSKRSALDKVGEAAAAVKELPDAWDYLEDMAERREPFGSQASVNAALRLFVALELVDRQAAITPKGRAVLRMLKPDNKSAPSLDGVMMQLALVQEGLRDPDHGDDGTDVVLYRSERTGLPILEAGHPGYGDGAVDTLGVNDDLRTVAERLIAAFKAQKL